MEIERKYQMDPGVDVERLFREPTLQEMKDPETEETLTMHAVYFDTADRRLGAAGIVLRVRREDERIVATVKWNGSSEDGLHRREECNVPVHDRAEDRAPDLQIFAQSALYPVLAETVGDRPLCPLMEMDYTRRQVRLDTGKAICELSADRGEIRAGGRRTPILELEIELYSGEEAEILTLGDWLSARYELYPEDISKYQRGLDLLDSVGNGEK